MIETIARAIRCDAPRMYRVALRIVGSAEAAREVLQDACVKALEGAPKSNGLSAPATWLHCITVNCARDHLRKDRQRMRARADWDGDAADLVTLPEDTPAGRAEHSELYDLALTLVAALPHDCRSSFVLTQLDGYSYDEAAALEAVPRGTVASRVYRARRILLEQLSDLPADQANRVLLETLDGPEACRRLRAMLLLRQALGPWRE